MIEMRCEFESYQQWREWHNSNWTRKQFLTDTIIADIQAWGLIEPISNVRHHPADIVIDESRLIESITAGRLSSRKRADLLALEIALDDLPAERRDAVKILGAEGLTRLALVLRGLFPYYLSTEYLPTKAEKKKHYPIAHLDLMTPEFPRASFDIFLSAHVFEHVPQIKMAIASIAQMLKPGGFLISSFPFDPRNEQTITRAELTTGGEVVHLLEPEYHGNPVRPEEGSLVFQLPGWDILEMCGDAGLINAKMLLLASSRHGIAAIGRVGVFVLVAQKPTR